MAGKSIKNEKKLFIILVFFRGKGLGKEEHGIVKPVQVDQKKNVKGIGYGTEGAFAPWWDDLFNKTAIGTKIKMKNSKKDKKEKKNRKDKKNTENKRDKKDEDGKKVRRKDGKKLKKIALKNLEKKQQ